MTQKGDYRAHLRCKINSAGTAMVRCWDCFGSRQACPTDLRGCEVVPRITLSHLWMMSREYGFVLQVNDLMICDSNEDCPFDED